MVFFSCHYSSQKIDEMSKRSAHLSFELLPATERTTLLIVHMVQQ